MWCILITKSSYFAWHRVFFYVIIPYINLGKAIGLGLLKNRPLMITIVVIVVLVILVAGTASSNVITEKTAVIGGAFVPMQSFFYRVSSGIAGIFSDTGAGTEQENALLLSEVETYKMQLAQYNELVAENERLTAILEYKQNNVNQELKVARITGKEPGNWFHVFTIDLGGADGVEKNMTVITPDGLVGRVEEVGLTTSKVMSIIDGRSRISAIMERTRDIGVAGGAIGSDDLSATLSMEFLPLDSDIVEGDAVVTSGLDGIFPKGLAIGHVVKTDSNEKSGTNVTIEPYVDFRRLEEVIVVMQYEDAAHVVTDDISDGSARTQPSESGDDPEEAEASPTPTTEGQD